MWNHLNGDGFRLSSFPRVSPEAYVTACKPDFGYRIRGEIPDLFENEYK